MYRSASLNRLAVLSNTKAEPVDSSGGEKQLHHGAHAERRAR
jgi:hypothetical protein